MDQVDPNKFKDWISSCSALDPEAIEDFARRYYSLVAGLVAKRVSAISQREDIVQEVFMACIESNIFSKFRGPNEYAFISYMSRIVLNHIYSHYRKEKRHNDNAYTDEEIEMLADEMDIGKSFDRSEVVKNLNEFIGQLDFNEQQIIRLRLMGYPAREIAEMLDKPKGTVDTWMAKAIQKLRDFFRKSGYEV